MMSPAKMTPSIMARTLRLKSQSRMEAARVPVQAPVPGRGIPTPNIFAGGENMHGRFEYVSLQTMERAVDTIIGIVTKK